MFDETFLVHRLRYVPHTLTDPVRQVEGPGETRGGLGWGTETHSTTVLHVSTLLPRPTHERCHTHL